LGKFFRSTIVNLTQPEILALVDEYESEVKKIKHNILKMCWYMRGGVTYNELMDMSVSERNIIGSIIEENLETTKKSGLAFF
jgi:hypothetical protein